MEVKFGPDGGYVTVFCYYCGLAFQERPTADGKDDKWAALEIAKERMLAHEREHPEWKPPMSLKEIRAVFDEEARKEAERHAAHGCVPNPCNCICACPGHAGCSLEPQDLCWECELYSNRGRDEHGRRGFEVPRVSA